MAAIDTLRRLSDLLVTQGAGHYRHLGLKILDMDRGRLSMELPYRPEIIGNPENGVIHGGALTALLDTCCGFAAITVLDEFSFCPTIDLRIDYMTAARPNRPVIAEARIIRATPHVIFARGIAHQGDPEQPVAHCSANFVRLEAGVAEEMRKQVESWLEAVK